MSEFEAQCWICPYCFDDHSQDSECEIKCLKRTIEILKSRASQFESTLKETMKARDELKEKLKIATEALEFYSKESSYYVNGTWDIQNHIDDSDLEQKIIYQELISVGGKRAREALEKLKEMEK